jgi:DNA replication protein DnaC
VRTLFSSATALIAMLGKALAEGRLDERIKILSQPQLLIIDEIGYLPFLVARGVVLVGAVAPANTRNTCTGFAMFLTDCSPRSS